MKYPIVDLGNSDWKGLNGGLVGSDSQFTTRNLLREITLAEYERLAHGDSPTPEVAQITYAPPSGGKGWTKCFAFGGLAVRLGGVPKVGITRYTPDYIGVACAYMLSNLYKTDQEVCLVALNAPSVRDAKDRIDGAYLGKWTIAHNNAKKVFAVKEVKRMEEVTGGMWLRLVNHDRTQIMPQTGTTMVIDIGGGTTEFMLVLNGKPQFDTVRSVKVNNGDIGINPIMDSFASELQRTSAYSKSAGIDDLRTALNEGFPLTDDTIRRAFVDKSLYINYMQKAVDVTAQFKTATDPFITQLTTLYTQAGGLTADLVYTTGGGGYLMLPHLITPLRRQNKTLDFIDPNLSEFPQFANARGAQRFIGLLKNTGKLKESDNG